MFVLPPTTPLRVYIAGAPASLAALRAQFHSASWLPSAIFADALDPQQAGFCLALNRANCLAYDGTPQMGTAATALGMPRWVMLDCCLLPSLIVGFAAPREAIPAAWADQIDPTKEEPWLGVSEYIALPAAFGSEVVGVSLFSLASGLHLGRRTKALGLQLLQRQTQTGVAQYQNPSLRLHLAFGDLAVSAPQVRVHSRPGETFVYRVRVPEMDVLDALRAGEISQVPRPSRPVVAQFDPRDAQARDRLLAGLGPRGWSIVGAGPVVDGALTRVDVSWDE